MLKFLSKKLIQEHEGLNEFDGCIGSAVFVVPMVSVRGLQDDVGEEEELAVDGVAQFTRKRVQYARAARLEILVEHHARVLVELERRAICAPNACQPEIQTRINT